MVEAPIPRAFKVPAGITEPGRTSRRRSLGSRQQGDPGRPTLTKPKPCYREGLTYYLLPILILFLLSILAYRPLAAQPLSFENALAKPILAANQPLVEAQVYTASHVKSMPLVSTAQQWTQTKEQWRRQLWNEVVLRGQGRTWAEAKTRVGMARRTSRQGLSHQTPPLRGRPWPVDSRATV